jgi:hypothetical protein
VKRYRNYERKISGIVKRFGKYRRKLWNDMKNMDEMWNDMEIMGEKWVEQDVACYVVLRIPPLVHL